MSGTPETLFRLDGRAAIVTGASSGLGVAFARQLAAAGARVAVVARRTALLERTVADIEKDGGTALAVTADVRDPGQCRAAVARAHDRLEGLDILVNNAGVATAVPAVRETPDEFRAVVDLNLCGAYWMAQASAAVMPSGSSIINISSVLALTTAALPQAAYTASKAALLGLTRDLAQQWGPRRGIRVNAIAPGFVQTEMTDGYRPGYVETVITPRILLGRFGSAGEIASVGVWLASPAAGYVTGQTIVVDGGMTIT
ncbi:SDR family NAD(P)-dependent oxidoreductase [Amycolatopsis pithecellobii]|uniref:SDR family oxidoreductase n=1 Tax=Amycolatopsis pithecellobii TaxID=664692 RepID=A0A6N7YJA5_9PSEU|nr:SDR family oxidoreductase [Amycolatopsis pithecellobii]MTD52985.1 SDR family oxidoreductase [Amycolatopsis pithecellobii]